MGRLLDTALWMRGIGHVTRCIATGDDSLLMSSAAGAAKLMRGAGQTTRAISTRALCAASAPRAPGGGVTGVAGVPARRAGQPPENTAAPAPQQRYAVGSPCDRDSHTTSSMLAQTQHIGG